MKLSWTGTVILAASVGLFAINSQASDHHRERESSSSEAYQSSEGGSSGGSHWGAGFALMPSLMGPEIASAGAPGVPSAASVAYRFNSENMLQGLFAVGSTSPVFNVVGGALFKHGLVGSQSVGLHIGGGFAMGNYVAGGGGQFFFSLTGLLGAHAPFPGTNGKLMLSVEGGPLFQYISLPVGSYSNFQLMALSSSMGLSVLYFF